jgi:replication-associated recombination protein RarA
MSDKKSTYELKTKNGYPLPLVRSALQKCIRYQREQEAGYWLAEMHESGYTNYALSTLALIAVEDCAGDPQNLATVMSILSFYRDMYKEKKAKCEYGPALGVVTLILSRSRQSRWGDNFWCFINEKRKSGWRLEVPEYAVDEHVSNQYRQPHQKNRSWRFWVKIASRLNNPAPENELGGTDYSQVMNNFWMRGCPNFQDEPDYELLDTKNPDAPIVEKPWNPKSEGSDEE